MSEEGARHDSASDPDCYEIRIKGHLDNRWADWLEGLALSHESDGTTRLRGLLSDQAALHGVLNRIRDLGVAMVSVRQLDETDGKENS